MVQTVAYMVCVAVKVTMGSQPHAAMVEAEMVSMLEGN